MEWIWAGAIAGGVVAYLVGIDLLSRWTARRADVALLDEDEDDDADGSDPANADVDD